MRTAVYNLVEDMDELILRVGSRTLHRLDETLSAAERAGAPSSQETLVRIAIAYYDFRGRESPALARFVRAPHGGR